MLIYDAEYFDPKATIESGQLFRYDKLSENEYNVYSADKKCHIAKDGNKVIINSDDERYFYNFFDLDRDYAKINGHLLNFYELKDSAVCGKGIRILKQNLYECIISFIISANNNIPRIKGIIRRLCEHCGEEKQGFYAFPDYTRLREITSEKFREMGAGFRDTYLFQTIKILYETDFLKQLPVSDNDNAYKMLCTLPGVGPKVADCVMLFGLNRLDRFPVDVWMFRACKNDDLNMPAKVKAYYSERYGEYAGIAQQYIFYYARENKFVKN